MFKFFLMFSFLVLSTMVFCPVLLNNFISVAIILLLAAFVHVSFSAPFVNICTW